MSGYQYDASRKERKAAKRLRDAGWSVSEPSCPECHGNGYTWAYGPAVVRTADVGATTIATVPCSLGCHRAALYFRSPTNVS